MDRHWITGGEPQTVPQRVARTPLDPGQRNGRSPRRCWVSAVGAAGAADSALLPYGGRRETDVSSFYPVPTDLENQRHQRHKMAQTRTSYGFPLCRSSEIQRHGAAISGTDYPHL